MTRQSTALLTVGPRSVAPWGDTHIWRVSGTAQLVEGSIPYWIVTPTQPPVHRAMPAEVGVEVPYTEAVVESILLLLALHFGDDDLADYLVEHHNLTIDEDGVRLLAPYPELADDVTQFVASRLSASLRLGFTYLDDLCLVSEDVISVLRDDLNFSVSVFAPTLGLAAG
jgi:hypothetical protein